MGAKGAGETSPEVDNPGGSVTDVPQTTRGTKSPSSLDGPLSSFISSSSSSTPPTATGPAARLLSPTASLSLARFNLSGPCSRFRLSFDFVTSDCSASPLFVTLGVRSTQHTTLANRRPPRSEARSSSQTLSTRSTLSGPSGTVEITLAVTSP